MGKRGKGQKKYVTKKAHQQDAGPEDLDDEIDAFHKQRDFVPLDADDDLDETDEDEELPVYDLQEEEDEESDDEDVQDKGLASKIIKQKKYLRAKFGDIDDGIDNDDDQDDEEKKATWGGRKGQYRGGDNADFDALSSDDDALVEEEAEVLNLQRKAAEALTAEDFGLEEDSDDDKDRELTFGEISAKGNRKIKSIPSEGPMDHVDMTIEKVKKDINALSREEQMDVVYSSAPELVGLLSELNDSVDELEKRINPLMNKIKGGEVAVEGGVRYLEVKQLLLLAYCQAITFYLLLKSEGQPATVHPVIARLMEIKSLLDKMKELDGYLPSDFEEILTKNINAETAGKVVKGNILPAPDSLMNGHGPSTVSDAVVRNSPEATEMPDSLQPIEMQKVDNKKEKGEKRKRQDDQIGLQSMEMLKVRAALEEKLKNNGSLGSVVSKRAEGQKHLKSVNGKLESFDDYVDDADNAKAGGLTSNKLSQLVSAKKKPKIVSGDDDLPKRDDIGERRRKHELRVLAGANVRSEDDVGDDPETHEADDDDLADDMIDNDTDGSEDDFYEQVRRQREAKLAAKAQIYSRTPSAMPSLPESVDGKRQITYSMEKNRGLTRKRNKDLKNPRKKYRTKHEEKVKRRKGQVQQMRKPSGTYGGETTGINAGISRSIRFKG